MFPLFIDDSISDHCEDMTYIKTAIRNWIRREAAGINCNIRTSGVIPFWAKKDEAKVEETAVDVWLEDSNRSDGNSNGPDLSNLFKIASSSPHKPPFVTGVEVSQAFLPPTVKKILPACLKVSVDPKYFLTSVLTNLSQETIIKSLLPKSSTYVIDYSSPNIAKPFHYGHLKSTIIGNFLGNLLAALNQKVVRINYLGDWGTQYGLLSLAYRKYGDVNLLKSDPCRHLLDIYVKINQEAEKNEEIKNEGKRLFHLLELGKDDQLRQEWTQLREESIRHYNQVYKRLGVSFDHIHWESMYAGKAVENVVESFKKVGKLFEGVDGAKYFPLPKTEQEGEKGDQLIPIIKSDGSSLYLTRDIAAAIDRKEKFSFDHMLYVVEGGQWRHFTTLKESLRMIGTPWFDQLTHVKFGRIHKMSTRKGSIVLLEDVLNEARERQFKKLQETESELPRNFH